MLCEHDVIFQVQNYIQFMCEYTFDIHNLDWILFNIIGWDVPARTLADADICKGRD